MKRRKDGDYEQQIWRFNQTYPIYENITREELEEKNKNTIVIALAIIGAIAAVAGIAFAVYKYLTPDYLEDFDPDDYSDDFDDDYIEFSDGEPEAED